MPSANKTRNQVVAQAARGFESHPIRHIAGAKFALLRLFYARISSLCAFGDFPVAFKAAALRQNKPCLHRLCRGDFRLVIQVGVDVRRGGEVAAAQPLLNVLEGNAVGQQQAGTAVTQIVKAHPAQTVVLQKFWKCRGQIIGPHPLAQFVHKRKAIIRGAICGGAFEKFLKHFLSERKKRRSLRISPKAAPLIFL